MSVVPSHKPSQRARHVPSKERDPSSRRNRLSPVAALTLVGGVVVGGAGVVGVQALNKSDRAPAVATNQSGNEPAPKTIESPRATPTDINVTGGPSATPNVSKSPGSISNEALAKEREMTPIMPTSTDPQTLVEQLYHNLACASNFREARSECFALFARNPNDPGWDETKQSMEEMSAYKDYYTTFGKAFEVKVLPSEDSGPNPSFLKVLRVEIIEKNGYGNYGEGYKYKSEVISHRINELSLVSDKVGNETVWRVERNVPVETLPTS